MSSKGRSEQNFMEDIEQSLLKKDMQAYFGIDDFQRLFQKKKLIVDAISQFQSKNKESQLNIQRAQQRLYQIEQLADRAQRQGMLLRNQIDKINDAHMMTKILTIQKMIKAKMEHEGLEQRKNTIFRIREERNRASLLNRSRNQYKTEKIRQMSLLESKVIRNCIDQRKYQTIEEKKSRADKVREDKQRIKDRIKRYQQFKVEQGRKNYMARMSTLKDALEEREKKLENLYRDELKEEKNFHTTEQVTKQYLGSLFPTQTI